MEALRGVHGQLATVLVLYYTVVGVWGIVLGIRNVGVVLARQTRRGPHDAIGMDAAE